jgi:integrase
MVLIGNLNENRKPITHLTTHNVTITSNQYIHAATSDNTRKAYCSDIKYLENYATSLNPRTLARRLISFRQWHILQGYTNPTVNSLVSKTLKGIKRTHGTPMRKATGLLFEQLLVMSNHLTQCTSLRNLHNNALLLLQFAGAFRVSELLAINIGHLSFNNEGVSILIPKSKTDKKNEGKIVLFLTAQSLYVLLLRFALGSKLLD